MECTFKNFGASCGGGRDRRSQRSGRMWILFKTLILSIYLDPLKPIGFRVNQDYLKGNFDQCQIKASLSCQKISSHSTWACIHVRHRSRRRRTRRPLVPWCSDLTLLRLVVTCYEIDGYTHVERAVYQRESVRYTRTRAGVGDVRRAIGIAAVVWRSFTVGARTCTNGA